MIEEINEIIESIADMVCGIDKAPMELKMMGKLSVLSGLLPTLGERMNGVEMSERQKYNDKFENVYNLSARLVNAIKDVLGVLPDKKVEREVVERDECIANEPEDTLGLRFLGRETEE